MFVVITAQSAATSRAYAVRYNERLSETVDLLALGLANMVAPRASGVGRSHERRGGADPWGAGLPPRDGPRRGGARRHQCGDPDVPRQSHPGGARPPHRQEHAVPQNREIRVGPRPPDGPAERPLAGRGRWTWQRIPILRNGSPGRWIVLAHAMDLPPLIIGPGTILAAFSTHLEEEKGDDAQGQQRLRDLPQMIPTAASAPPLGPIRIFQ